MKLKETLVQLRESKALTVDDVAERTRISYQDLENWEDGYTVPSKYHLEKLATIYEVSVEDLVKINFLYKARLMAQRVQEDWLKYFFFTTLGVIMGTYLITLLVNMAVLSYNTAMPRDAELHRLKAEVVDDIEVNYVYQSDFVFEESLDADIHIRFDIPIEVVNGTEVFNSSTFDGLDVTNSSDVIITGFECLIEQINAEKLSVIIEMTLGNEEGLRYATSNEFVITINEEYIYTTGDINRSGDMRIFGGESNG